MGILTVWGGNINKSPFLPQNSDKKPLHALIPYKFQPLCPLIEKSDP